MSSEHGDSILCRYPVCGFLGLPFTHAATVRSITHLKSLTDYTTEHVGEGQVPRGQASRLQADGTSGPSSGAMDFYHVQKLGSSVTNELSRSTLSSIRSFQVTWQ